MPPEPIPIIAWTIWKPVPCASCHGCRNAKKRARRYGSNQIATVPSAPAIASAAPSTRAGVPATSSIAGEHHASARSPCRGRARASAAAQKTPASAPTGRHSSRRSRGAGCRARYAAAQIASASFASSDGWKTAGPSEIQRRAPLTGGPDHEHRGEQAERDEHEHRRERAQPPVVPALRDHHQHDPERRVDALALRGSSSGRCRRPPPTRRSRCRPSRARTRPAPA